MKKKKGQWTEMCINSIMTKSRIHYIGRKSDSDNGLGKSKKKRSKKVSWTSFLSSLDTLSLPIVTRNMSRHFDTWKQCLPRINEDGVTQMRNFNNFPLWNYRSGIITRALSKKVDIGPTNSFFAALPAPLIQENQLLNQNLNDNKKVEQLQYNFSDKYVKRGAVRNEIRPLVTRTRKLHLRNKVLSYIYQDAKVWWGCGDVNSQNSTAGASENKLKSAGSDAAIQHDVQRVRHNASDHLSVNSRISRQTTSLPTLNTLTIPIVTRSISKLFQTWQQSFPKSSQDLQTQLEKGTLWYNQSGMIRKTMTESSGFGKNQSTVNLQASSQPHQVQPVSSSEAKEKEIPQQTDGICTVRARVKRSDGRSMITRSRKLYLRNKVLNHIYPDAKNWWDRGDSSKVGSISKALEYKQGSGSRESTVPLRLE